MKQSNREARLDRRIADHKQAMVRRSKQGLQTEGAFHTPGSLNKPYPKGRKKR